MTLPRPHRALNEPIPNAPFVTNEVYFLRSPQGEVPISEGLEIDPETGTISLAD